MKVVTFTTAVLLAAFAAGAANAATVDWTKAGAVSAVKTATIWKDAPPQSMAGFAGFKVVSVQHAAPYGRTRRVKKQLRAARWNMTVTMSLAGAPAQPYNICVTALGPVKTHAPFTAFRIGGWNYAAPNGGCSDDNGQSFPQNSGSAYAWGGSLAYRPTP